MGWGVNTRVNTGEHSRSTVHLTRVYHLAIPAHTAHSPLARLSTLRIPLFLLKGRLKGYPAPALISLYPPPVPIYNIQYLFSYAN